MKRNIAEENDTLLQIGKEGKEGDKNFLEYTKGKEKEEKELEAKILQQLEDKRKSRVKYNEFLCNTLLSQINDIPWGKEWRVRVSPTEVGVVMEIKTPADRTFRGAFKSNGDIGLDLNAVKTYALRAENTYERMKHNGIITDY